jgi:hypothetical protein
LYKQGPFFNGEKLGAIQGNQMPTTFTDFKQLDEEAFFVAFVKEHFERGWPAVATASKSKVVTDTALIKLAHARYLINIKQYVVALRSANPDHYKRAAALLHALYLTSVASPIAAVEWDASVKRLRDHDAVGVSHGDAEYWNDFTNYYEEYCNPMLAFDLAFRCCDLYEAETRPYDKDYLDNICYYMTENREISVASFVMIFKSYWFG